jgi:hypothetical protein
VPGWPSGAIGNLSDWSLYCRANNLLLSPGPRQPAIGIEFLSEWMTATNSEVVWSEGVLKVGSYGDTAATGNSVTWTPNLTPAYDLTEDDFQPVDGKPVKLEIVDQSNAYNIVQVEFLDRANQYNTGIAAAQDLANITQYGRRKQDPTTLHCICDGGIAQHAAQLLLQRTLYMREEYTFTIPDVYALLEPMIDTVTLTTTTDELKLNRKQVRLVQITENADGTFACTAIGMDIGTASAALYKRPFRIGLCSEHRYRAWLGFHARPDQCADVANRWRRGSLDRGGLDQRQLGRLRGLGQRRRRPISSRRHDHRRRPAWRLDRDPCQPRRPRHDEHAVRRSDRLQRHAFELEQRQCQYRARRSA